MKLNFKTSIAENQIKIRMKHKLIKYCLNIVVKLNVNRNWINLYKKVI